uniref:Uncharacterized protein n=1 Tax=viral metagenome TaxID=1070528 RepID=A0A6C0ELH8_9ZZZZ
MSKPQLDLQGLKDLFKKGLRYAKKQFSSTLISGHDDLINYQLQLADKATTLQQLVAVSRIVNPVFANAFWDPKPVCDGCELQNTGIQFGVGTTGWYFLTAVVQGWCYNLSIFRLELAPPQVVVTTDRNQAVRWQIFGGYGKVGGKWYTMQDESIYMNYTQPSYSTFSLVGAGTTKSLSFSSTQPMVFNLSMSFTDTNGAKHSFQSTMTPNVGPQSNAPNSCLGCVPGMGSMYYSYTSMNTTFQIGQQAFTGGIGWIDHQNAKVGQLENLYERALLYSVKPKKSRGWLWFAIQDKESGIQYMFTYFYPPQKFYIQAVKQNTVLEEKDIQIINVYKEGKSYFKPTDTVMDASQTKVRVLDTILANGVNLPSKYAITLPGGKNVILVNASAPNVYPVAHAPYECPALLLDETGSRVIGAGLIEANFYLDNETYAKRMIVSAGGNYNNQGELQMVMNGLVPPQTGLQKFLTYMIVLIPLWILIAVLVFTLYKKDQRHVRLIIALLVLFISYGIAKKI